jgi:TRAP-type C4-dicarboxylate transport system permease small subunit
MDPFEKKRLLPIEVMIALAINLVVAILGYYAIMMWGLFRGWRKLWREIAKALTAGFRDET